MTAHSRLALGLHDAAWLIVAATAAATAFPAPALAYVDPSVMTYTIQALAGVAVALSAVLGVAFRRSRRALMRLLRIDEDARKQAEPDLVAIDPDAAGASAAFAAEDEAAREAKRTLLAQAAPKPLAWRGRFARALLASLFLVGTLFIVAPLEVVGQSTFGLLFGFYDILALVLAAGVASAVVLALLLSALRGRAFDTALVLVAALGISCYAQALFMNSALPVADGDYLHLDRFVPITVTSALVWVALIAAATMLARKRAKAARIGSLVACAALLVVQTASVVSVATSQRVLDSVQHEPVVATHEGLYTLSPDENVVVFVLDTYDQRYLDQALADDPRLLDEFTGFTCFTNSTGSMIPTRYAVPFLMTGRMPDGTEPFRDFTRTWFQKSTLLPDIRNAGYTVGIYTDSLGTDIMNAEPFAMNVHEAEPRSLDIVKMLTALDRVALYRDMPWVLKPLFWFTTDDLNKAFTASGELEKRPYMVDDGRFGQGLSEQRVSLNDEAKSFRFIHMLGPHKPYSLDEEGRPSPTPTTREQQARGSLALVADYLRQMKELGLYDDATIVVTADHGNWQLAPEGIIEPTSVIMLVKPPESAAEAAEPVRFSDVPTGHLDYAATIADAVGADASKYGPTVFQVPPGPRQRFYWATTTDWHEDVDWTQWAIDGEVLDWDDWQRTGTVVEIPHR